MARARIVVATVGSSADLLHRVRAFLRLYVNAPWFRDVAAAWTARVGPEAETAPGV